MSQQPMALIKILWSIRDSGIVRNSERQLLDALAMRCRPKEGYKCWPSYRQVARHTSCNVGTLKKAAAALEEKNLIRRTVRRNRSNYFYINIVMLVEQAAIQLAADKAATDT
jgi:DNA-binding transcriptional regulator YhcF (GntR family)